MDQITVYDAAYAILAQENKCDLIIVNIKFVKRVNLPFIKQLADYPTSTSLPATKSGNGGQKNKEKNKKD